MKGVSGWEFPTASKAGSELSLGLLMLPWPRSPVYSNPGEPEVDGANWIHAGWSSFETLLISKQ